MSSFGKSGQCGCVLFTPSPRKTFTSPTPPPPPPPPSPPPPPPPPSIFTTTTESWRTNAIAPRKKAAVTNPPKRQEISATPFQDAREASKPRPSSITACPKMVPDPVWRLFVVHSLRNFRIFQDLGLVWNGAIGQTNVIRFKGRPMETRLFLQRLVVVFIHVCGCESVKPIILHQFDFRAIRNRIKSKGPRQYFGVDTLWWSNWESYYKYVYLSMYACVSMYLFVHLVSGKWMDKWIPSSSYLTNPYVQRLLDIPPQQVIYHSF